jgi:predicted metal-dependent peptidase
MSSPDLRAVAGHVRFARAYAADRLPWFAPALFRSRIVLTEAVGVAAIDCHYNVYWNPAIVTSIWGAGDHATALSELAFLWVHEISHRLRRHGERAGSDDRRWNLAADLEINDSRWPGLSMPAAYPGHLPADYQFEEGQLAEAYYRLLGEPGGIFNFTLDEGSGVHGRARPWEVGDRQRISEVDEALVEREVARRIQQASEAGMPGGWRGWSDEILRSRTNWRQLLGHRMSIALRRGIGVRTDYSFTRPSRRQSVYHPILPPRLSGDRTARIVIVVDTSGSMEAPRLQRALAEVAAVIRQFDYPVTIIPCDIQAYEPVRLVAAAEAYRLSELPGGSGTHMPAGIQSALHLRPRPDVILVLTDGFTPYPEQAYAVPVLFGILTAADEPPPLPPQPPFTPDQIVRIPA